MQVRLLGPVDVTVDGTCRPVPGLRRKAVLAVLGLHPGQIVSTDRLIDVVWGGNGPSDGAEHAAAPHVLPARRARGEGDDRGQARPGYVLDLGAEATDVETAERLIRPGATVDGSGLKRQHLRGALALWRGRPLLDVVRAGLAGRAGRPPGPAWTRGGRAPSSKPV